MYALEVLQARLCRFISFLHFRPQVRHDGAFNQALEAHNMRSTLSLEQPFPLGTRHENEKEDCRGIASCPVMTFTLP